MSGSWKDSYERELRPQIEHYISKGDFKAVEVAATVEMTVQKVSQILSRAAKSSEYKIEGFGSHPERYKIDGKFSSDNQETSQKLCAEDLAETVLREIEEDKKKDEEVVRSLLSNNIEGSTHVERLKTHGEAFDSLKNFEEIRYNQTEGLFIYNG